MIYEILFHFVFDYLSFYDKHVFQKINKRMLSFEIIDLKNIDHKYLRRIDNTILNDYKNIKFLDSSFNTNINNINRFTNLKELITHINMKDDDIARLNLEVLNANHTSKIKNINHMSKLRKLSATYECGINDEGIKHINLCEINISNNMRIDKDDLKHMENLTNIIDDYDEYYFMPSKWKY